MSDNLLTPDMAVALHQRALERSGLAVWVIAELDPDHSGVMVARLITEAATPYVLTAGSLPELRAMLPRGLEWSERQPADPRDVIEVWVGEA